MGAIPLPALAVQPQNAYAEYLRMAQLQQQTALEKQQTQQVQGENQQKQLAMRDQKTIQDAMPQFSTKDESGRPTGYDWDGLYSHLNGKVMPQTLAAVQKGQADLRQSLATAQKDELNNQNAVNKGLYDRAESLKQIADPSARQTHYEQTKVWAHQHGHDVTSWPEQVPGNEDLTHLESELGMHAQAIADNIKERETTVKESQATTAATSAQNTAQRLQAEMPGGALETPERAQQRDWLKKNPGKGPSDFLAWKAKQAPLAQIAVANAAGGGMEQGAIDQAAEYYHMTGKLPPAGRGVAGLAQGRKIMNRAAELYPGSMTADSAEYGANKKSLDNLQKNFDAVTAFENTAGKNLDTFLTQAKKVVDFGSPLVNMPLRKAASLAGGSDQAAFNAARTTALTEIAKVLNSSNATGVLSDSARHEVEGLIGENASLAQIYSAANILKTDMANRHQSYADQIADIKGRMPGKKSEGSSGGSGETKTYQGATYIKQPDGSWKKK